MPARVHYHTDCPWFAGCESMLANLLNDHANRQTFDVSLSYRASPAYTAGLVRRVALDFPVFPLRFPEPSMALPAPVRWPNVVRRLLRALSRLLATYPLLAYEIWVLRRLFLRLSPDVVHINNGGYPAALSARAAAIAANLAGVSRVVMVVNNLAEPQTELAVARRTVDRRVVASVSRFVTGSAAASAQLQRVLSLRAEQCAAFPNGIALRMVSESRAEALRRLNLDESNGTLLGVVALMETRKGHRVLIEAVAQLVRGCSLAAPFTVLLEGDGPLREQLGAQVRELRLEQYCRFVGNEANVANLMAAIDVLVLPSVAHEDFPNVILEAMGFGRAVIASSLAGTPEQIEDGVTGILVPAGDPRALAMAISRLLDDAVLREEMGRAGRRRFEDRFTASKAVSRYIALYQSLIAEGNS
jgi:glycosyltransferase involved in cell wall biosynthesis